MIFSKRSKKQNHISHHVSPCTEFNHAMAAMQYCVDTQQNLTGKLAAIDYFMRVIKMDIQSDFLSSIIYSNTAIERRKNELLPSSYYNENGDEHKIVEPKEANVCIDLSKGAVFAIPWEVSRISSAISSVFKQGYKYDKRNILAFYYAEMDFTLVVNGLHHTSAAIVQKKGFINAINIDVRQLFPHVYTDGLKWYDVHTDNSTSDLCDFRFGILFEAAKLKNKLLNGKSIDVQHEDNFGVREDYFRNLNPNIDVEAINEIINERNYYKFCRDLEAAIASPNEKETVIRIEPFNI